ncbi:MAG: DMT family transporter, partial [Polyangia bacterium]
MRLRPELILVGVTVLWGSTFIVTKDIVRDAPPMLYLVFRFGLAAVLMLALYGKGARKKQLLVDGVLLGVLNSLGLILQVYGQVYTTASKSAFITSLNTPLVPLVAFTLYRTRPSTPQLVAVVLATVGLMLLTYPAGGARWNTGDLYTVGCAIFYAFTIVQIARRSPRHDARALTVVQLVTAALVFTVALVLAKLCLRLIPPVSLPEVVRL